LRCSASVPPPQAAPPGHPQAAAQALDLAKKRSHCVRYKAGNQSRRSPRSTNRRWWQAASPRRRHDHAGRRHRLSDRPLAGSDPALKPIVISGHMDVVEAKPPTGSATRFTRWSRYGYLFAADRPQ